MMSENAISKIARGGAKPTANKIHRFESRPATRRVDDEPKGFADIPSLEDFFKEYVWTYQERAFREGYKRGLADAGKAVASNE